MKPRKLSRLVSLISLSSLASQVESSSMLTVSFLPSMVTIFAWKSKPFLAICLTYTTSSLDSLTSSTAMMLPCASRTTLAVSLTVYWVPLSALWTL